MGLFDPPLKRRADDPPDLKLAIMAPNGAMRRRKAIWLKLIVREQAQSPPRLKEESSRAGTNYLWHPDFREYAKIPGQYPLDYESFYHNPKNKADREKHQKLLETFRQKEGLDLLLQRHTDKKEGYGGD